MPADQLQSRAAVALARMLPSYSGGDDLSRLVPPIVVPMHLAVDSAPFEVRGDGAAALLKVMEIDALGTTGIASTAAASRQAARLGVAPALLGDDEESASLLYEFLAPGEWKGLMRPDLDDAATLGAVLTAKRTFHGGPALAVTRSPFGLISEYLDLLKDMDGPEGPLMNLQPVQSLLPWIGHFEEAFRAAGSDLAPTHGENAMTNVMLSAKGDVRLVDFDRAVNADPIYDLASFCHELCSFDEDVERVVALYLGQADKDVLARTRIYMIVDDFIWALWGLIQHFRSPRSGGVEFYKYAHNRFLRAQYRLGRCDVGAELARF